MLRSAYISGLVLLFAFMTGAGAYCQESRMADYLGESLEYSLYYSFIRAGEAKLSFDKDSSGMYHIKMDSKTIGLANSLYHIRDIYECIMDPQTAYPLLAIRNVREGRYRAYNEVTFDHSSREDSSIVYSQKKGMLVVPKDIYDILSGFYLLRKEYLTDSLQIGDTILIETYFTDEVFDLKVRYVGKEKIKTEYGKINCLKFNPVTEVGRAFKTQNDMSIWFSDDKNHLPVKVWLDLRFGSVRVDLIGFKGLKYEHRLSLDK